MFAETSCLVASALVHLRPQEVVPQVIIMYDAVVDMHNGYMCYMCNANNRGK